MSESHKQTTAWLLQLATRLNKRLDQLDMYDLLENKRFFYDLVNTANKSHATMDDVILDYAHDHTPDDVQKGVSELVGLRREGAKEILNKPQIAEKAYVVEEPQSDAESLRELSEETDDVNLFYDEESAFYFKRVERPVGTRARRFGDFRNQNRQGRRRSDPSRGRPARPNSNQNGNPGFSNQRGTRNPRQQFNRNSRQRSSNRVRWRNRRNLMENSRNRMTQNRSRNENFRINAPQLAVKF